MPKFIKLNQQMQRQISSFIKKQRSINVITETSNVKPKKIGYRPLN